MASKNTRLQPKPRRGGSEPTPDKQRAWLGLEISLLTTVLFTSFGCDYDVYPLAPTYCDDWCRATQRASCENDEPHRCVLRCEISTRTDECAREHRELLDCYRNAPDRAFYCDFMEESQAIDEPCSGKQQSMIECEVPAVLACKDLCREYSGFCGIRRNLPSDVPSAQASGEAATAIDAVFGEHCSSVCTALYDRAKDPELIEYFTCLLDAVALDCNALLSSETCGPIPSPLLERLGPFDDRAADQAHEP